MRGGGGLAYALPIGIGGGEGLGETTTSYIPERHEVRLQRIRFACSIVNCVRQKSSELRRQRESNFQCLGGVVATGVATGVAVARAGVAFKSSVPAPLRYTNP